MGCRRGNGVLRETFPLAHRSLRRFELVGPCPRTKGATRPDVASPLPRELKLWARWASLGVDGPRLCHFPGQREGRDGGGGGNPGSPLLAAAPTASAQASSAPRTEPGPVACCALPAERRHLLSAAFANLWGAPGDPGGEGGGPHPPPAAECVDSLGNLEEGRGRRAALEALRARRAPGPAPRRPTPTAPQDLLGGRRDGNERLLLPHTSGFNRLFFR